MKAKTKKAKPGGLTLLDIMLPYVCNVERCIKSSDKQSSFLAGLINLLILSTVLYCILFLRGTFSFSFLWLLSFLFLLKQTVRSIPTLLLIVVLFSCSPKVISYEIEGEMIQTEVAEEKKERKPDKIGRTIAIGTLIIIYGLIFIR